MDKRERAFEREARRIEREYEAKYAKTERDRKRARREYDAKRERLRVKALMYDRRKKKQ